MIRPPPRSPLFPSPPLFRPRNRQALAHGLNLPASNNDDLVGEDRAGIRIDQTPCADRCELRRGNRRKRDRKSTRLNSSHLVISYAVFCLKKNINLGEFSPFD